jgi:glycosyltransferase involved in cell wall biosynthesis
VLAGLTYATGDGFLVIDVDCEDPPEMIPQLIDEWEKGVDIVYGERWQRTEALGVQAMRLIFYRLNRMLADSEIILDMAEFALVSQRVRDLMLANRSTFPFLRTEIGYVGFERKGIRYKRQPRLKGRTHYNFIGMAKFAVGGILSSSTFSLRLAAYILPPAVLVNLALVATLAFHDYPRLFRAVVLLDMIYALFCLTSLSLYTARIYKDGIARPVFIVDWDRSALNAMPADTKPQMTIPRA